MLQPAWARVGIVPAMMRFIVPFQVAADNPKMTGPGGMLQLTDSALYRARSPLRTAFR